MVQPLAALLHWVLCRQRDAGHDDDDHDERVEEGEGHDAVDEDADTEELRCSCHDTEKSITLIQK